MLTTKNYKFKKPELTDSPPDITVMNPNWDDIDEKLFAVIQAWEEFKANGGEIGGNIVRVNHEKQYDWIFGHSGFTDKSAMISLKDRVTQATMGLNFNLKPGISSSISPISNGEIDFGLPNYTFKDIYVGSVSKNSNGHTKLPNGMILQWGKKTLPMNNDHTAMSATNFPITFPTEALVVIAGNVDNSAWRYPDITCGAKITSKAAFTLWAGSTRANTGTININLSWIAIGY